MKLQKYKTASTDVYKDCSSDVCYRGPLFKKIVQCTSKLVKGASKLVQGAPKLVQFASKLVQGASKLV